MKRNYASYASTKKKNDRASKRPRLTLQSANITRDGFPKISRGVGGNQQMYKVSRIYDGGFIQSSTIADTASAYYFLLNSLPGYAEFTALYDQYRIDSVEIMLKSQNQKALPSATAAAGAQPYMILAPDYDDVTSPATALVMFQKQNVRVLEIGEDYNLVIKPHVALGAYAGAFNGYANETNTWIDTSSVTVQHYGWKYYMIHGTASTVATWHYYVRFNLSLKNLQ